jgi:hypothetical protein
MPYISQQERINLAQTLDREEVPMTAGGINFTVTSFLDSVIAERGLSYATINEIIGVLECIKLELYRRVAAPYEDLKKSENGDVYSKENLTP